MDGVADSCVSATAHWGAVRAGALGRAGGAQSAERRALQGDPLPGGHHSARQRKMMRDAVRPLTRRPPPLSF